MRLHMTSMLKSLCDHAGACLPNVTGMLAKYNSRFLFTAACRNNLQEVSGHNIIGHVVAQALHSLGVAM